jgi:hypothetical protein
MTIKPEERTKVAVLGIAALGALGFLGMRIVQAFGGEEKKPASAPVASNLGVSPPATATSPNPGLGQPIAAVNDSQPIMNIPAGIPNTTGRDPFKSPLPNQGRGVPVLVSNGQHNGGQMKPIGNAGAGSMQGGSVPPMPVAPPPPSELELKGVVSGGRPMAVIRIGSSTLTVYEGQSITKTLVVKKITPSMVVLRNKNTDIPLSVGSMTLADVYLPEARGGQVDIQSQVPDAPAQASEEPATTSVTDTEPDVVRTDPADPVENRQYGPI